MSLTEEQISVLLRPIASHRVKKTPEGYSHVEAYDIRAMLNRIFGFAGWSLEDTCPAMCVVERPHELRNNKPGIKVAYRAHVTITILQTGARYSGSAVAEATMPDYLVGDAHDMALKSAESGALKRAASNLGDQFGLSLYNDGSTQPLVQKVVGFTPQVAAAGTPSPADPAPAAPLTAGPPPRRAGGSTVKDLMAEITTLSSETRTKLIAEAKAQGISIGSAMTEGQVAHAFRILAEIDEDF